MKKIFNFFLLSIFFIFLGCENILNDNSKASFALVLGEENSSFISRSVSSSSSIPDNEDFIITCDLIGRYSKKLTATSNLELLNNVKFFFNEVPYGSYIITISVNYKDMKLFSAKSEEFDLNEYNTAQNIDLTLLPHSSKVSFEMNGGVLSNSQHLPSVYNILSSFYLPSPFKDGYKFIGWYTQKDGQGEKIVKIGKDNYLGDVTLYAHYEKLIVEIPTYTVSFVTDSTDGKYDPIIKNEGEVLHLNELPLLNDKEGFVFAGWLYNGKKVIDSITVTNNISLVPNWITIIPNVSITSKATTPLDKTKKEITLSVEGVPLDKIDIRYTLDGSTVTKTSKSYSSPIVIDSSCKQIKAKAFPVDNTMIESGESVKDFYTVKFNNNGFGTITTPLILFESGETLSYSDLEQLNHEGQKFNGWAKKDGTIIKEGDAPLVIKENTVLTAQWEGVISKVTVEYKYSNLQDRCGTFALSTTTLGAEIFYTTDGTEPNMTVGGSTSKYGTRPIYIQDSIDIKNNKIVIKAIAVKDNKKSETMIDEKNICKVKAVIDLATSYTFNIIQGCTFKYSDLPHFTDTDDKHYLDYKTDNGTVITSDFVVNSDMNLTCSAQKRAVIQNIVNMAQKENDSRSLNAEVVIDKNEACDIYYSFDSTINENTPISKLTKYTGPVLIHGSSNVTSITITFIAYPQDKTHYVSCPKTVTYNVFPLVSDYVTLEYHYIVKDSATGKIAYSDFPLITLEGKKLLGWQFNNSDIYVKDGDAPISASSVGTFKAVWQDIIPNVNITSKATSPLDKAKKEITLSVQGIPQDKVDIRYTLDGSPVTKTSKSYSSPFVIDTSTKRIKAKAFPLDNTMIESGESVKDFYSVTFNNGGVGTGSIPTYVFESGEKLAFSQLEKLSDDKESNKGFIGWQKEDKTLFQEGEEIVINKDITLTAQWKLKVNPVTFTEEEYYEIPSSKKDNKPSQNRLTTTTENVDIYYKLSDVGECEVTKQDTLYNDNARLYLFEPTYISVRAFPKDDSLLPSDVVTKKFVGINCTCDPKIGNVYYKKVIKPVGSTLSYGDPRPNSYRDRKQVSWITDDGREFKYGESIVVEDKPLTLTPGLIYVVPDVNCVVEEITHEDLSKRKIRLYLYSAYIDETLVAPKVDIRYTTDGSPVTKDSPLYTSEFEIDYTCKKLSYKGFVKDPNDTTICEDSRDRTVSTTFHTITLNKGDYGAFDYPTDPLNPNQEIILIQNGEQNGTSLKGNEPTSNAENGNMIFKHWMVGDVQFEPWDTKTEDKVLTAKWQLKNVEVSLPSGTADYNSSVTLSCPSTVKSGEAIKIKYTLDGTDPSPTNGLDYTSSIDIGKVDINKTPKVTLKAIALPSDTNVLSSEIVTATYDLTPLTIHFDANAPSEEISGTMADLTAVEGGQVTLPTVGFTRKGYVFEGWHLLSDGSDTTISDNSLFDTAGKKGSVTLYAKWNVEIKKYTVTYDGNGGYHNGVVPTQTLTIGKSEALNSNVYTKTGYNFIGWNKEANPSDTATNIKDGATAIHNLTTVKDGNVTLYAQWEPISYTIHFDSNNVKSTGEMSDIPMVYGETKALTLNAFEVPGYSFDGWYLNKSYSGTKYTDQMDVTNLTSSDGTTVNLYAKWIGNTYTVSFDANGGVGELMATQTLHYDSKESLNPNTYTRVGYQFIGWNTSDKPSDTINNIPDRTLSAHNLTTVKDGKITLYAQWEANSYSVAFDANGGVGSMSKQDMKYGTPTPLTKNSYSKKGYHFIGWNTSKSPIPPSDNIPDENSANNLTVNNNETVTLYAQWEKNTYTVYFESNNSLGGLSMQQLHYDTEETLNANTFNNSHFIFKGWNIEANPSNPSTNIADKATAIHNLTDQNDGSVTLYAQWEAITYTINFDNNDSVKDPATGSVDSVTIKADDLTPITTLHLTRNGYKLEGWTTTKEGSGTVYKEGERLSLVIPETGTTVTLYAKWTPNKYNVHFDSNNPDSSGTMNDLTLYYEETKALPTNAFEVLGYSFDGWYLDKSYSGNKYTDKMEVINLSDHGNTDVTLYAKWIANNYTIHFDANGGEGQAMSDQSMIYDKSETLYANTYKRTGYKFIGWNKDSKPTDPKTNLADNKNAVYNLTTAKDGKVTLYAQWEAISYTIHFDSNNPKSTGTMNDIPMVYGQAKALTVNAFEVPGYSFDGWYLNKSYSGTKYTDQMDVTNLTSSDGTTVNLYAKWLANAYTVSFDANGGTGSVMKEQSLTYDKSETLTTNTYTRDGYNFIGWNKVKNPSDTTGNITDSATAAHNLTTTKEPVTLYAQWEVITYTITYMNCDAPVVNTTNPTSYTVEDEVIFSDPTKTDNNFLGWFDDSGFATASQNISKGTTGNKTIYAKWIVSANLSDFSFSKASTTANFIYGRIKGTDLKNIFSQVKFSCEQLTGLTVMPYSDNVKHDTNIPFYNGLYIAIKGPVQAGDYTIVAEYPGERVTTTLQVREYDPVNMGDILLNDGTIVSKDKESTLTAEQRAQAVGIALGKLNSCGIPIFIKKTDEGNKTPLAWAVQENGSDCPSNAILYVCSANGADNLQYVKDSIKNPIDVATQMPAFAGCDDTWFVPSKEEFAVYTANIKTLHSLFTKINGEPLQEANPYWTSSFDINNAFDAYTHVVNGGTTAAAKRTSTHCVRLFGTPYLGKPLP